MYKYYKDKKNWSSTDNMLQASDNIKNLFSNLTLNQSITTLQYDALLRFLDQQKENQKKLEIGDISYYGEDLAIKNIQPQEKVVASDKNLQKRILEILDRKRQSPSSFDKMKVLSDKKFSEAFKMFKSSKI